MSAMEVDQHIPDDEDFHGCVFNEKLPYADRIEGVLVVVSTK